MRGEWSITIRSRVCAGRGNAGRESGSTFVIVLWVAFGLVSIALYFAQSMNSELRAADHRVSGLTAEQAIDAATRYVSSILNSQISYGSNGTFPDPTTYLNQAVPVGEAHFWLIGRDTNLTIGPGQLSFGLVDEASKLDLNFASSNMLAGLLLSLPRANPDLASAILDWRDTNSPGSFQTYYATRPQPYQGKSAPFESIDELHLLYAADLDTLTGEDLNRNGVLDLNEPDDNRDGVIEPGILEYVTVYTREPNTYSNGTPRITLNPVNQNALSTLLENSIGSSRAGTIIASLFPQTPAGPGGSGVRGGPGGGRGNAAPPVVFRSPLEFFRRCQAPPANMTADEFSKIASALTVSTGPYITGRVNINTASATVLTSLPGLDSNPDLAQTIVNYRLTNPDKLTSVAWIVDALGNNNASTLDALQAADCLTTQTFQVSADIAALGPNGRGYRRARFVFDTSDGTVKIVYRQDLTHLGWALGKDVRDSWVLAKATP